MHIYKAVEWEGSPNHWYVNDVQELSTNAGKWWMPMRMLQITPEEYVNLLVKRFNANHMFYSYEHDVLTFSFATQQEARKFKNWINAEARKRNFIVGK